MINTKEKPILIDLNQYERQYDFANVSKEGLLFSAGNNQGGDPIVDTSEQTQFNAPDPPMTEFGLPLAEFINESGDMFKIYTGFFGTCKKLTGYLLLIGSMALPIYFPLMVGVWINAFKEYYFDKSILEADFSNVQYQLDVAFLATFGLSAFCQMLQTFLHESAANQMTRNL